MEVEAAKVGRRRKRIGSFVCIAEYGEIGNWIDCAIFLILAGTTFSSVLIESNEK